LKPEAAELQRILAQFPTQTNRENILKNREFSSENRQFLLLRASPLEGSRPASKNAHADDHGNERIQRIIFQERSKPPIQRRCP
jgi:hypothetical protein